MKAVTEKVHTAEDLDLHGREILDLLAKGGQSILENLPNIFLKMVTGASLLIESTCYIRIIQKMAESYKLIPRKPQHGPLECLVVKLENKDDMKVLSKHQEKLLLLIQTLVTTDDSTHSRTRCLRALVLNGEHLQDSPTLSSLKWTKEFIFTMKLLLENGADPSWTPDNSSEQDSSATQSVLMNFFLVLPLLCVSKDFLVRPLMEILPLFQCDKYAKNAKYQNTALHALTNFNWKWLYKHLAQHPSDFFKHYKDVICKVVELYPSLVDKANMYGITPLNYFIWNFNSHEDVLEDILEYISDITLVLRTETNIDMQDENGKTPLHDLAERSLMFLQSSSEKTQEVFLVLVKTLASPFNTDLQDKHRRTPLHTLAEKCNQHIPEHSQETLCEVFKILISQSNLYIQEKRGYTVLHILVKNCTQNENLAQDLLNIFSCVTTSENVNVKDRNSVTPYSWILTSKLNGEEKGTLGIFSKIEEIFLQNGADADLAKEGVAVIRSLYTMKEVAEKIHTEEDLDLYGQEILELLTKGGLSILENIPKVFLKMVFDASHLIGSTYYIGIIQKMAELYKLIPRKPLYGPMECLVVKLENKDDMKVLSTHQEKLLLLIQILIGAEDSSEMRTRVLWTLILSAQYATKRKESCLPLKEEVLEWTEELVATLGLLLKGGADPTWIPDSVDGVDGSSLYNFLKRIPLILAHKNYLFTKLMTLLPWFLTKQCLNHREPEGPVTMLHAMAETYWTKLPEDLPGHFSQQYKEVICKVVETNSALRDMTNDDGRNPLQCFICQIKKHKDLNRMANDIIPALKTENNVNAQDKYGQTVLHILAGKVSEIGHEAFLAFANCLKSSYNTNIQDKNGQTVLHILAEKLLRIDSSAFPELVKRLRSQCNIDMQNGKGQTVLHILARVTLENQQVGCDLMTIFPLLITERNMNMCDNASVTPFSWILIAKSCWLNSETCRKAFSETEEIFLSSGADADRGRKGLVAAVYRWVEDELSDRWRCTSDRLQRLLSQMKAVSGLSNLSNLKSLSYLQEFKKPFWENLGKISNTKLLPFIMDILRMLITSESTAQHAWSSMMKELFKHPGDITTLSGMEILSLCAERGAQPTDGELQKILSHVNDITKHEELTIAFLKTLVVLRRNMHFACSLQFLGDFYILGDKMFQLGRQLVHAVHGTLDNCLESKKLIDCFLFISHDQGKALDKRLIEDSYVANWLKRSPLHLACIFLKSENSLKCLPQDMVTKYLNAQDLHGCTPLHLAYLHHNKKAVQFLITHGATEDVIDKFGMSPKSLERFDTSEDHPDIKLHKICQSVLEVRCGVLEQMAPMLIHSEAESKALKYELTTLLERLVKETQFERAEIAMTGSMREQLKTGCFDEADIQLRFASQSIGLDGGVFLKQLSDTLVNRLTEISLEGIYLRPISVHGPWKFLREGRSSYAGITLSVDVVAVLVHGNAGASAPLTGVLRKHSHMDFCTLGTGNHKGFRNTYFPFEWDMIDSLPTSCRLAIVIAKALVQAYDMCSGDSVYVKMPITSYTIKTALFYILARNSSEPYFTEHTSNKDSIQTLRNALENLECDASEIKTSLCKLKYNPKPKWTSREDLNQHGEEARFLACKIFTLIKCLAEQGKKLRSYWDRNWPVVEIGNEYDKSVGEAEYICEVCDCVLERLNPSTF